MGLRVTALNVYPNFASLPDRYKPLFRMGERKTVFLGLDWFRHFEQTALDPSDKVRIYGLEDNDGEPFATLAMRTNLLTGPRLLGGLANFYTLSFAPLVRTIDSDLRTTEKALTQLFSAIRREDRRWATIQLPGLGPRDDRFATIDRSLRAAGFSTFPALSWANWHVTTTPSDFDAYYRARRSKLRKELERQRRKLWGSEDGRFVIVTGQDGLKEGIEAYLHVYGSSWREAERYGEFIPGFIRLLADKGFLRLGILYAGTIPAAAQLWIVQDRRATIYKVAYDKKYGRRSVGHILMAEMMRHVIDADLVTEVDFGSGDDLYKADWMSARREIFGITAHDPLTPRGLVGTLRETARNFRDRIRLVASVH